MRRIGWGKGGLIAILAVALLPLGVPRWLSHDGSDAAHADARFTELCRAHGGTPSAAVSATAGQAQRYCTVRYGTHVYRMDAVTSRGFDADTARFQRQGCDEAQLQQHRAGAGPSFVYHPKTGVCEQRP